MPFKSTQAKLEYNRAYSRRRRLAHPDKVAESTAKWRLNNINKIKDDNAEYRNTHKDYFSEKFKEWRLKNKEYNTQRVAQWKQENKDRVMAHKVKFYSNHPLKNRQYGCKKLTGIPIEYQTIQSVYENNIKQYGTLTCYLCLTPIPFGKDCLEHRTPSSRGGDNSESNLGVAHTVCNYKKRSLTESEYREKISKALA